MRENDEDATVRGIVRTLAETINRRMSSAETDIDKLNEAGSARHGSIMSKLEGLRAEMQSEAKVDAASVKKELDRRIADIDKAIEKSDQRSAASVKKVEDSQNRAIAWVFGILGSLIVAGIVALIVNAASSGGTP